MKSGVFGSGGEKRGLCRAFLGGKVRFTRMLFIYLASNAFCLGNAQALSLRCSGLIGDRSSTAETWSGTFWVDGGAKRWSGKLENVKSISGEAMDLELQGTLDGIKLVGWADKGVGVEVFWAGGESIAGTLIGPEGKLSFSGKCEVDVDTVVGALGTFSGELPPEEAWPERYRKVVPDSALDPVKNPREFFCSLRGTTAEEVGSIGLLMAIEANCPRDFGLAGGGGSRACDVGPPESNPPAPPSVAGALVNVISRSLQQWPHITQSEVSASVLPPRTGLDQGIVAAAFSDLTAYLDVSWDRGQGGVGFAWSRDGTRTFEQNPQQLAFTLPRRPGDNTVRSVSITDPAMSARLMGPSSLEAAAMDLTIIVLEFGIARVPGVMVTQAPPANKGALSFMGIGVNVGSRGVVDKPWFASGNRRSEARLGYLCFTGIRSGTPPNYKIYLAEVPMEYDPQRQQEVVAQRVDEVVSTSAGAPDLVQGCQVAEAPDGKVWLSWWERTAGQSRIRVRWYDPSRGSFGPVFDASGAFVAPEDATASQDCQRPALKGHIRYLPFPSMALDPVDGRIYIAYAVRDPNPPHLSRIVVARSTDGGATWVRWMVDDAGSGDRFMPALAVSAFRTVRVMWYDRRNDPNNLNIDVYYDTGVGWSTDARLTMASFGVPRLLPNFDCQMIGNTREGAADCYMGDYNSVSPGPFDSSQAHDFLHAWGDNSLKFYDPDLGQDVPDPDVRATRTGGVPHRSRRGGTAVRRAAVALGGVAIGGRSLLLSANAAKGVRLTRKLVWFWEDVRQVALLT